MLTYDKGIFKRIMKPAGLQFFVNSDYKKELNKCVPKKQEDYWKFLYPNEIVDLMGISSTGAFSRISNGDFDKKHVSLTTMDNLKLL